MHRHKAYIQDTRLVDACANHMDDIKDHSSHTAIELLYRERCRLVDTAMQFLPHADLDEELDQVADSIQFVDELLTELRG
jgi:hypothetical protein